MSNTRPITLILLAYLFLASSYALLTPVFEAGDELWHYPMVAHLADGNPLPVQVFDPNAVGLWKQQASQPPLYYYLGAALTAPIDTSDLLEKRWLNPHVNNGIITADGNTNLAIHNPDWNAFAGTLLAVRVVRFLSVALGAMTVYYTWKIGRLTHPHRPALALAAASMVAFLPMFLFISGAVNNDNLIMALSAVTLYRLIRHVVGVPAVRWRDILLLGVLIGLATIAKIIGVGLLPLALGTLFIANWRDSKTNVETQHLASLLVRTAGQFAVLFVTAFAVGGWWYVRNSWLYGDWKGWNAFIAVLGERPQPATLAQLWDERFGFMQAFWGLFGGVNVPLPSLIYTVLNWLLVIGVVGFMLYAVRILLAFTRTRRAPLVTLFNFVEQHFALVVCLLWTAAVVFGLIRWATTTWSSQGRLVFAALPAEMVLLTTGLFALLPKKVSRIPITLLAIFMFMVAAYAPWGIIRPAYQPANASPSNLQLSTFSPVTFDNTIRLNTAAIEQRAYQPDTPLDLYLEWELLRPTDGNWSVFVHLNDPVIDNPIAQRDMYLGGGLLATSFMQPGDSTRDHYRLHIPPTAVTPAELQLLVGLYDVETGLRLGDATQLTTIAVTAPPGDLPNPTQTNFGNQFDLIGYQLSDRTPTRGEPFDLTLYFRAEGMITADYSISAQILPQDIIDTTRYGNHDQPLYTTTWQPGAVQQIDLTITPSSDTPADIYRLVLKAYTQQDGAFTNLQLAQDGRLTNDTDLTLTKIRVNVAPPP